MQDIPFVKEECAKSTEPARRDIEKSVGKEIMSLEIGQSAI